MGGISIWQLLIVVVIVVLLFGTKKLSSLGADLGASIKGFKKAMSDGDEIQRGEETFVQDTNLPLKSYYTTQDATPTESFINHNKEQV